MIGSGLYFVQVDITLDVNPFTRNRVDENWMMQCVSEWSIFHLPISHWPKGLKNHSALENGIKFSLIKENDLHNINKQNTLLILWEMACPGKKIALRLRSR